MISASLSPEMLALACGLALLLWMIALTRRIYRLARYFQLEGYDSQRYLRWFGRSRAETRYTGLTISALLVSLLVALAFLPLPEGPFIMVVVCAALALSLIAIAPRDRQIKQPFKPTNRARRLLAAAFALALALPILGILRLAAEGASGVGFAAMLGPLALALAPISLPLANALVWPIEEYYRRYFMRLAKARLKQSGARVIVITGSYGKTSTKHYVQHLLSARYRTLMTPKSFNTLMGISRAINETMGDEAAYAGYDFFIAEADAYFVGENASICRLIEPEIGLVMSVGPMHLERLGSMANIAKAQYEIIEALPPHGVGIFNGDDPEVRRMYERGYPNTRLMVTQRGAPGAQIEARNARTEADGLHFDLYDARTGQTRPVYAPLYGETNVTNLLMASAVALHLGLTLDEIAGRAASLRPADHRMVRTVLPDGTVIIDDAYSANPVGTRAALDVLKLHTASPRRIVISSGMFELGERAEQENRALGEYMAAAATDVILIGEKQAAPIREGLISKGFPADRLRVVGSLEEAVSIYRALLQPGDALLMLTDLPDLYAN